VVFVDNLTTSKLSKLTSPVQRPTGAFIVNSDGTLSSKNSKRYEPYITLAESMNLDSVMKVYTRFYPHLQKSYAELGNGGYFNDRVIKTIDSLLETPTVTEPIHLNKVITTYEFTDTELENLNVGQKIMIRMGADNSARAKVVLKQLRQMLTHLSDDL
jgi:hypothetical protein